MPRPARRFLVAVALATAIGVPGITLPAAALAASDGVVEAPELLSPEEGAFVDPAAVVLEWSAVDAPAGYEVAWSVQGGSDHGVVHTTATSTTIAVEGGTIAWQVRALPDGEWSDPAVFTTDFDLPTLGLDEQPAVAAPATPAMPRSAVGGVPAGVWIIGALAFSAVFLGAVVVQSRVQRERDA